MRFILQNQVQKRFWHLLQPFDDHRQFRMGTPSIRYLCEAESVQEGRGRLRKANVVRPKFPCVKNIPEARIFPSVQWKTQVTLLDTYPGNSWSFFRHQFATNVWQDVRSINNPRLGGSSNTDPSTKERSRTLIKLLGDSNESDVKRACKRDNVD